MVVEQRAGFGEEFWVRNSLEQNAAQDFSTSFATFN